MARVFIRRIVVHREAPLLRMRPQLGARKRKQGPDQSTAAFSGNAREPCRRAATQEPEEDGFRLIVRLVGGDEIARAATALQLA